MIYYPLLGVAGEILATFTLLVTSVESARNAGADTSCAVSVKENELASPIAAPVVNEPPDTSHPCSLPIKKKLPLKEVKKSLKKRTLTDKNRKHSPLIRVKDSILIRSDQLTKKQVLSKMSSYIDRLKNKN